MERTGVLRSRYGWITQNSFRAWARQRAIRKTGSDKMAEVYSPRKALRGKLLVRYQGLTLRFAVNVDIFEQIVWIKNWQLISVIFGVVIWPKNWHFGLSCQTNGDMQQNSGGVIGLLGVMMAIYISWYHSHIIMTLKLKLNKKQFIEARTVFSTKICVVRIQRVKGFEYYE